MWRTNPGSLAGGSCGALFAGLLVAGLCGGAWLPAQTPHGAEPADEDVRRLVAAAVAAAGKSVVGVARVGIEPALAGPTAPVFPRLFGGRGEFPSDADLVPLESAAGVVLGENQVLTRYHVIGPDETSRYSVWCGGA